MISLPKPPLSPYGTFSGDLFQYASNRVAFESNPMQACKCILIGGLSDGLLPVPYTERLLSSNYSLVQPIISSSYTGFGHGSLQRDSEELHELVVYLRAHRQAETIAMVGHSTGCQNIVHYLRDHSINLAVLQAPVSDREHAATEDGYEEHLKMARSLQAEGKAQEMVPRSAFWAPITAQRLLDLHEKGGSDDFFSSDFSDEELASRLGHVGTSGVKKCVVAFSGVDEYVPDFVNGQDLTNRLVVAMNSNKDGVAESLYLSTGNHNLSTGIEDQDAFVARVTALMNDLASGGLA